MSSPRGRWVCLDVGETLIEETRVWTTWADELGVPRMTFLSAFGAIVERGLEYHHVFEYLGVPDWRERSAAVERLTGGFQAADLYPDALASLAGLRAAGYRVAVMGNQPARRTHELRALGVPAEVMVMSEEMGVAKPDPLFFVRMLELLGGPEAADVAYVGDRIDNDVRPASAAGLRAVWIRRGPWGVIPRQSPPEAALVVGSLAELVGRIEDAWRLTTPSIP
jgi:HAD superfamily hydrolase (TIGR01549 family)